MEELKVKSKNEFTETERIGILGHEIASAERLIKSRQEWLNNTINKKKPTYSSIANDTREMELDLADKKAELEILNKKSA